MRPRERYTLFGAPQFGDDELLALVLGVGDARHTAVETARALLDRFGGLRGLADAPVEGLTQIAGVGAARAVRLHAALQVGLRAARSHVETPSVVNSAATAVAALRAGFEGLHTEELHALYLNRRLQPLAVRALTRGTESATLVDPRQVFRPAIQCGAAFVVAAHNHPSGDLSPSADDLAITQRLVAAGRLLGVPLLDHLILAGDEAVSLASRRDVARPLPGSPQTRAPPTR